MRGAGRTVPSLVQLIKRARDVCEAASPITSPHYVICMEMDGALIGIGEAPWAGSGRGWVQ